MIWFFILYWGVTILAYRKFKTQSMTWYTALGCAHIWPVTFFLSWYVAYKVATGLGLKWGDEIDPAMQERIKTRCELEWNKLMGKKA